MINVSQLTRFEKTRLISARALQLAVGAPILVKSAKQESMDDIAKRELESKVLPLSVLREYPNGDLVKIQLE